MLLLCSLSQKSLRLLSCAVAFTLVFVCSGSESAEVIKSVEAGVAAEHEAFFNNSVLPILETHCFKCHAGEHQKGEFRLDQRSRLMTGSESGAVVNLDSPEESILLQAVRYDGYEMPPRGKLADSEIAIIEQWVSLGVPYPADRIGIVEEQKPEAIGAKVSDDERAFWSFRPIQDNVPPVGASHPVDAFIDQQLASKSVTAVGPASPRELIRRLSFDMTGLPPSEELQREYEADPTELKYLGIVDEMLASPAHGERWARHWLDLVRWAESNSYERDGRKPEVWRYRSYVIDSFNGDRPYDQFTAQQIAGDEMPFSEDALIATGYYRLGIWDDEPADPKQALYDDLDDIVAVTGQVFLGLTVNCARCHDHKIDPITHADYYRLLAFFSGLNRYGVRGDDSVAAASLRPLLPPGLSQASSQEIAEFKKSIQRLDNQIATTENKAKPFLLPVELQEFFHESNRVRVLRHYEGQHFTKDEVDKYEANLKSRAVLNQNRPADVAQALVVTEQGSEARPTHVLLRGNPHAEGDAVEPGFLEVLGGGEAHIQASPNPQTSGRRTALANWMIDPKSQPMTARAITNRIWQYHFGRGLVRTPSDFGFAGAPPTHPELLDYLASRLVENGWHLKPLHRLIVTSDAYKRASRSSEAALTADPENDLLWRFDPRRLSAEEIRDSMLAACGRLDSRVGGQSVFPNLEAEVLAGQSQPGAGWDHSSDADRARRSIYVFAKRSLSVPLLASFDAADTDFTCPVRFATTQPTQALGLMNSVFVHQVAKWMADDIKTDGTTATDFVGQAMLRVTQRPATASEIERGVSLIDSLQKQQGQSFEAACQIFCLTALNLNEFIFLD